MKATGFLAAVAVTLTLAAGSASAHPGHGKHYDDRHRQSAYWKAPKRVKRMPDWLYYQPQFRRWYRHSDVKHMRKLSWRQVYRIYKRQAGSRHYRRHYYSDDYYYYDDRRRYDRPRRRG